ncbi:MAG: matrixin family metalloprotease [Phycisphaerales bacterium]
MVSRSIVGGAVVLGMAVVAGGREALHAPFVADSGVSVVAVGLPFELPGAFDDGRPDGGRRGVVGPYDAALRAEHQAMLARRLESAPLGKPSAVCFAPGTPDDVITAFNEQFGVQQQFKNSTRWSGTAYTPGGSAPGKPLTISYSVVPDGTPIAGFNGEAAAPSGLRAKLNAVYGSEAVWLPVIQSAFNRWAEVTGITYIYEANDDGVDLATLDGEPGVRGDVRIGGHLIDGNSGVLAYNFFPDEGDMVIDSADNFYDNITLGSRRLKNVLQHEHGHGLGMNHVCPVEQTKLMEPTVSSAYEGIRHDDIRHGQFLYGDDFEPNDSSVQATNLGALGTCTPVVVGTVPAPDASFGIASIAAIERASEKDWFQVTVAGPRRISAVLSPVGWNYDDSSQACGGQPSSCCTGSPFNSNTAANLTLEVLSTDGATVLASSIGAPSGSDESVSNVVLPAAGTYFIRIGENAFTQTQQYRLTVTPSSNALSVALTGALDVSVDAGSAPTIAVAITGLAESLNVGASTVEYTVNGGMVQAAPLASVGGTAYQAMLGQVLCTDSLTFRVVAVGSGGSIVTLPCDGTFFAPATGVLTTAFSDDFEANLGWTVGPDTATAGTWVRADPIGTVAQPEFDNTAGAGTQCFFTGQAALGAGAGTADLDGGETFLTSPTIDLSGQQDATISYWRWFANGYGAGAYNDRLRVQVSNNNGGSWTPAETVGPGSATNPDVNGGWRFFSFTLSSLSVTTTATMRVRFIAEDANPASLVEAAIDDVRVVGSVCVFTPPATCYLDYNLDGSVNPDDLGDYITDYYTVPHIPGPGGYAIPCPENDPPYDQGYKVGFVIGNEGGICNAPNPDNLGDYITDYYSAAFICPP